jgi:hypothetical protein
MKNWLVALLFLFQFGILFAQKAPTEFDDYVWMSDIRTVEFRTLGDPLKLPTVELGRGGLMLGFDLMGEENASFLYKIIHCNSDWTPSALEENEYLDGFYENRIKEYDFSIFAQQKYIHYSLRLPNSEVKWTKSGNYILKIYLDDDDKTLALTRRFIVFENQWNIGIESVVPSKVDKNNMHQELDYSVNHKNTRLVNPNEVWTSVLQNGRWDNAFTNIKQHFVQNDQLEYNFQDSIVFPAGKQFRYCDVSNFDYNTERVKKMTPGNRWMQIDLLADKKRYDSPSFSQNNIDGNFEIGITNTRLRETDPTRRFLQAEYSLVNFQLDSPLPIEDKDVYLFGGLTDWQIQPQFKMEFDQKAQAYFGQAYLKMGLYNYEYAVFDPKTGKFDLAELEGNWYTTPNRYTVIAYWRPHGGRYDRVMGLRTIRTTSN